jgi:hypothetical protein
MDIWYATREDVLSALDAKGAARDGAQLDRALSAGSRAVDALCQRDFAPVLATKYFDWPNEQTPRAWRLWLDRQEVITVSSLVSGGETIPPASYFLEPANAGPPYRRIEINLASRSAFGGGSTYQRSVAVTGLFGYSDDSAPAGTLVGALNSSATAVTVTDSSAVGVGDLMRIGAERMTVTRKRLVTSGQTLQTAVTAKANDVLIAVTDGTAFHEGEVLTLGGERMLVQDIAGNSLTVKRAWDGSVLGSHSSEAIYVPRLLTVTRAAAGATAATALDGAAITRWVPPAPVHALAVAEAMNLLLQEQAGYARTVRAQTGGGASSQSVAAVTTELNALRDRVRTSHGRQARTRAV